MPSKSPEQVAAEAALRAAEALYRVSKQTKASTLEELKRDVRDFLDVHFNQTTRGFSLAYMNRRFGKASRALGLSIQDFLFQMQQEGLLVAYPYKKSLILLSSEVLSYLTIDPNLSGEEMGLALAQMQKMKDSILSLSLT
jgi:hypothetical protein